MIQLTKSKKPVILEDRANEWTQEYQAFKAGDKNIPKAAQFRYRDTEIKEALRTEAYDKCIYCESKISHTFPGETDHIYPISHRPDLVVEWENLAYVCKECNHAKSDYYDLAEPLINPFTENPSDYLIFFGPLILDKTDKGYRTIRQLKLDRRMSLIERRIEKISDVHSLLKIYRNMPEGKTKQLMKVQILEEASSDKEFSAFIDAFLSAHEW